MLGSYGLNGVVRALLALCLLPSASCVKNLVASLAAGDFGPYKAGSGADCPTQMGSCHRSAEAIALALSAGGYRVMRTRYAYLSGAVRGTVALGAGPN